MTSTLPYKDAVSRVGRAKFGAEWIDALTHREEWLLESVSATVHPSQQLKNRASGTTPGFVNYFAGKSVDRDPQIAADDPECIEASKRAAFMAWQRGEIDKWLSKRGFTVDGVALDKAAFDYAYSTAFGPPVEQKAAPAPTDQAIMSWVARRRDALKAEGKKHGRELLLSQAMAEFEMSYKVVRAAWDGGPLPWERDKGQQEITGENFK